MTETKRPLSIFLCHSSGDKIPVRKLYERLVGDRLDAWLDSEKLVPGQNWRLEIEKAVKNSDVVIVCLSTQSVTKEGFVQKEIKIALDAADEKPDGTIFIIPTRLETCDVPERMNKFQWVDLFSEDGYSQLLKALKLRADNVGTSISMGAKEESPNNEVTQISADSLEYQADRVDQGFVIRHESIPAKTYPLFIGRENELEILMSALRSPNSHPMVAIVGLGGMGKTTLVREAVDHCINEDIFNGIVWATAKIEIFSGERIQYIQGSTYSFESLVNDIIRQCSTTELSKVSPDERRSIAENLLRMNRILIVLDNLDTITDSEQLIDSIFQILGRGKLLITSRHFVKHERIYTIELESFLEDDGVRLLRLESKVRGIGYVERATRSDLVAIHNVTGGNPLAIKLVIGQTTRQPMEAVLKILKQASPKGQDYEFFTFLFRHSWALLDMKARMIWVDISVFPPLVGGAAQDVETVSQVKAPDFWPAIGQLVELSVVDKIGDVGAERFSLHPLSQYFIRSDITKEWAGPPENSAGEINED
jgi:hypothetical protein